MISKPSFPYQEIEDKLRSWWKRKTNSPLRRKSANARIAGGTVFDIQPEVSSVEAVEVFLEIEPFVGSKIKSSKIVKVGGYQSCDEFIQHILPQLKAKFENRISDPYIISSPLQEVRQELRKVYVSK